MKEQAKKILKIFGVYHPLQSAYRQLLFQIKRSQARDQFRKYKGEGFLCNICGCSYSRFLDDYPSPENQDAIFNNNVIAGYGENILCPNCLSTARERLIVALMKDDIVNCNGKKILHLSPEKNIFKYLRQIAAVTTADLLPGFYKNIDTKIIQEDATKFSFSDNAFDVVIANHILEHIPDDTAAIKEIFRILKPGGIAVLQVPYSTTIHNTIEDVEINDPVLQSKLFGQKDHVRIYRLDDYVERLRKEGFKAELIKYEGLEKYYQYAIQKGEDFLLITKPSSL